MADEYVKIERPKLALSVVMAVQMENSDRSGKVHERTIPLTASAEQIVGNHASQRYGTNGSVNLKRRTLDVFMSDLVDRFLVTLTPIKAIRCVDHPTGSLTDRFVCVDHAGRYENHLPVRFAS